MRDDRPQGQQLIEDYEDEDYEDEDYEEFGNFLPDIQLHYRLSIKVKGAFLAGLYDSAVFEAFKQVEISVREAGGYTETDYGTTLMRKAFDAEKGILTDMRQPPGEREAMSHLFAGAIGLYKNPGSHRDVYFTMKEATELIIVASHLLWIVNSCNQRANDTTGEVYWDGFKTYMKEKRNQLKLFPKPNLPSIYGIQIDQKTLKSGDRHKDGAFWLIAYRSRNELQANFCMQSSTHYSLLKKQIDFINQKFEDDLGELKWNDDKRWIGFSDKFVKNVKKANRVQEFSWLHDRLVRLHAVFQTLILKLQEGT